MVGLYGLQFWYVDGQCCEYLLDMFVYVKFKQCVEMMLEVIGGIEFEDKGIVIVLYCCCLLECFVVMCDVVVVFVEVMLGYELQVGNLVMEIKLVGMDKGWVVCELLQWLLFVGCQLVYVGDDFIDEYVFDMVVCVGGYGVRVGC